LLGMSATGRITRLCGPETTVTGLRLELFYHGEHRKQLADVVGMLRVALDVFSYGRVLAAANSPGEFLRDLFERITLNA